MTNYATQFSRKTTDQNQPIPGSAQVPNSGGGYSWVVDDWQRLQRFLILGAEGGTYYVSEKDLIKQNHDAVLRCIAKDGSRVVSILTEISEAGRAPKNDPAIFVLALVTAHGDAAAKKAAFASVQKVCRIGTHLFHFAEYVNQLRGWGRGLKKAVAGWYTEKDADDLAYQLVKYQGRDGWTHKDVLRLSHPMTDDAGKQSALRWAVAGKDGLGDRKISPANGSASGVREYQPVQGLPAIISAFEEAKKATTSTEIIRLISDHRLPRECVPTQFLNDPSVWEALLDKMPMTGMVRNLGKMSAAGLLKPLSNAAALIASRLGDKDAVQKSKVHPMAFLMALKVYAQGRGDKGSLTWKPVANVVDALNDAFYSAFANVEPSGKKMLLALDVSGSMSGSLIAGSSLTAREASAAMALVTAATEKQTHMVAFSGGMVPINISPRQRLDDVIRQLSAMPFDSTDCSLPFAYAFHHNLDVDGFVVYTDSETNRGTRHPVQALRMYRNKCNPAAKSVVVGMSSEGFTIADPNDSGMLDVVGFDSASPAVISDFLR